MFGIPLQCHLAHAASFARRLETFDIESTYLFSTKSSERCRIRRRQQGTNVSFKHQHWILDGDNGARSRARDVRAGVSVWLAADHNLDPSRVAASGGAGSCAGRDAPSAAAPIERMITGREYLQLLKQQADPACASIQKTLVCFTWGGSVHHLCKPRPSLCPCTLRHIERGLTALCLAFVSHR
eukprot:scaffold142686_cov31-Tisochrysis_lutea.AAC.2